MTKTKSKTNKQEEKVFMTGFKGFGPGMVCRGMQFREGEVFEVEGKAEPCKNGIHFCGHPLDVLDHYPLLNGDCKNNEFAAVEAMEEPKTDDSMKFCTTKIRIGAKLNLAGLIKAAVDFSMAWAKKVQGDSSKLAASGNYSKLAASGDSSQLAASGDYSKLAASGYYSQLAASGDYSQLAASGYYSQLAASGNYSQLAASGNSSQLAASGDSSKIEATGKDSVIASVGIGGKVKAELGCFIACAEWEQRADGWHPVCLLSGEVDGKKLKADTWYTVKAGKWVEAE